MEAVMKRFDDHKAWMQGGLFLLLLVSAFAVVAGTGADFDGVNQWIVDNLQGSLGKVIAVTALGVGLAIGIVRQSMIAVVIGIGIALSFVYGIDAIVGMFTATVPMVF